MLALVVLAGGLVLLDLTRPAHAATTGNFAGTGTNSPALTQSPQSSSVTWSGTLLTTTGISTCGFTGGGPADTIATAAGSGTMSCSGTGFSGSCSLAYSRTMLILTVSGNCSGSDSGPLSGTLIWFPTSNPTSSFTLEGVITIGSGDDIPPIPPLPGGPASASTACVSSLIFDGEAQGVRLKALVQQTDPTTTSVCIRAESGGQGVGGRLDIVSSGPGLPSVSVPATDNVTDACWTTSGNTVPGSHPAVKIDVPTRLYVDVYQNGSETWVCVDGGGGSGARLKFVHPSGGGGGIPSFSWTGDPGTPDPI